MRLIDKIALNRLIKIITDFILGLDKLFPSSKDQKPVVDKKPKRPVIDLFKKWFT